MVFWELQRKIFTKEGLHDEGDQVSELRDGFSGR